MVDPSGSLYIPHIIGVTLDNEGVARTQVIATNRRTGDKQVERVDANKVAIFDAANFTLGYIATDVIEIVNVGSSIGVSIITISDATGGFQEASMDCAAAATTSVNL